MTHFGKRAKILMRTAEPSISRGEKTVFQCDGGSSLSLMSSFLAQGGLRGHCAWGLTAQNVGVNSDVVSLHSGASHSRYFLSQRRITSCCPDCLKCRTVNSWMQTSFNMSSSSSPLIIISLVLRGEMICGHVWAYLGVHPKMKSLLCYCFCLTLVQSKRQTFPNSCGLIC